MKLESRPHTAAEEHDKREQSTRVEPSEFTSIADALVLKAEDIFLVTAPDGQIPPRANHGLGLYYHDCRFLDGYELTIGGGSPTGLAANADAGFAAVIQLTNSDIHTRKGLIPKHALSIRWQRILDPETACLSDIIRVENHGSSAVELPLSLKFSAEFQDIFAVRGLLRSCCGELKKPQQHAQGILFSYVGADRRIRRTTVQMSEQASSFKDDAFVYQIALVPGAAWQLSVWVNATETEIDDSYASAGEPDREQVNQHLSAVEADWLSGNTDIHSDSILLNRVLRRCLLDLQLLRSDWEGQHYFAAGVPWFVALFGRDSIITALQLLAYQPGIAEQTISVLARHQGRTIDAWRDEEPGKILHEVRLGELARLHEIPHTPYYGSVDATPLFLILVARHARWTGSLGLFHRFRSNIEAALEWLDRYGDLDGDGLIEYRSNLGRGLVNQGWKDSSNCIVTEDGDLAESPIALLEVQAYAACAKKEIADLFERAGDNQKAAQLHRQAEALTTRINQQLWMEEKGTFALGFDGRKQLLRVVTSNAGHALWTGVADPAKARATINRLLEPDMFGGWGIRTLSSQEVRYNPVGYHLGTVWPHDNSIIAIGCRYYGFDEAFMTIFLAVFEAATRFHSFRLPEVFSGYDRQDFGVPVPYPVACHPQAWAAGSIPMMLQSLLGIVPDGFNHRLQIRRPLLPDFVDRLEARDIHVADGTASLEFVRNGQRANAKVLDVSGDLKVEIED